MFPIISGHACRRRGEVRCFYALAVRFVIFGNLPVPDPLFADEQDEGCGLDNLVGEFREPEPSS